LLQSMANDVNEGSVMAEGLYPYRLKRTVD
jgi:hypothetical protein